MSGGIKIDWRGNEFLRELRGELEKRLAVAAEVVRAEAVKSIRVPFPPASLPGNPPHSRSAAAGLFGSVLYDVQSDQMQAIVGTPLVYGLYLELGTSKMAPRPWLRPALEKSRLKIQKIMTKPLPRG